MPRLTPLEPPYDDELAATLARWMPPGTEDVEPLALFRVLAHHEELMSRMRPLGAGLLGSPRLTVRERELLILRTTARAGAGYEWGVHVAGFASAAELSEEEVAATAAALDDGPWNAHERALLRLADELHDGPATSDQTLTALRARWSAAELLEAVVCCGWYRLLAGVIDVADLGREPWAPALPARSGGGVSPGA